MPTRGLAAHCHHDTLYEYVDDFDRRVVYIQEHKPYNEVPTRLRLFWLFPEDRLPKDVLIALKTVGKCCDEQDAIAGEIADSSLDKQAKQEGATRRYFLALQILTNLVDANINAINVLHAELCKDCTWNEEQQTIFPVVEQ